jgi:hypothetical protein
MNKKVFIGWCFLLVTLMVSSWGQVNKMKPTPESPSDSYPMPKIVHHSVWESFAPLGFPADATRKNISKGEFVTFKDLKIELLDMIPAQEGKEDSVSKVKIFLTRGFKMEEKIIADKAAFNWEGFHIAILGVHTKRGELGFGLTEFEVSVIDSMPAEYSKTSTAGDANYRARIPHQITKITIHHSGDPGPMTINEDPVKKLRALQNWGRDEKNWWDVPYHFLIAPNGTIYEGRDYKYMGETNTKYDQNGHLLITMMGNYELQQPTPESLKSLMDIMAWASATFKVPMDKIYGHCDLTQTDCPGKYLYQYLSDGTLKKGIQLRLKKEYSVIK